MLYPLKRLLLAALIGLTGLSIGARPARAIDRDVRAVLIGGIYGMAGGTAFGLVTYPVHRKVRGIFIGTSMGLFLGLIGGAYFVVNRDDPDNPFRAEFNQFEYNGRAFTEAQANYRVFRF